MRITGPRLLGIGLVAAVGWAATSVAGQPTASAALPGVPQVSVDAYTAAAAAAPPECHVSWALIAGIGAVESGHGTFGDSQPDPLTGVVSPPIRGPRLDGGAFARIPDTDGGRLDGDPEFDRAVGPMQFIPGTWEEYAPFPNADPQNIRDAAKATASLLCAVSAKHHQPLTDLDTERAAIRAYNDDDTYVETVLGFEQDFMSVAGTGPAPGGKVDAEAVARRLGSAGRGRWLALGRYIEAAPGDGLDRVYGAVGPLADVVWNSLGYDSTDVAATITGTDDMVDASDGEGTHIRVSSKIANQVALLLHNARQDYVILGGSGYRSDADQHRLRLANGCPDDTSPSSTCDVPTAPLTAPFEQGGRSTSNHRDGLAIDFTDGNGRSLTVDSAGYKWLQVHAGEYGLHNLPGEPWHWSTDGH